jgi:hypothetical protein
MPPARSRSDAADAPAEARPAVAASSRPPGRWTRAVVACLLLASAAACQRIYVVYRASTAEVVVVLDPDPNRFPGSCTDLVYEYTATRTGDAADAPVLGPGDAIEGDESSADSRTERCSARGERFVFPGNSQLKTGVWTFSLDVRADGVSRFTGTCPGVSMRYGVRHAITFTQPRQGTTATCTFSF